VIVTSPSVIVFIVTFPGSLLRLCPRVATPRHVAVARVTEIIASSPDGFREAVEEGIARAAQTLRGITGLEVMEKKVKVERGLIVEYRVGMKITFLLD
jgi:flavin-binding protein dodecin